IHCWGTIRTQRARATTKISPSPAARSVKNSSTNSFPPDERCRALDLDHPHPFARLEHLGRVVRARAPHLAADPDQPAVHVDLLQDLALDALDADRERLRVFRGGAEPLTQRRTHAEQTQP